MRRSEHPLWPPTIAYRSDVDAEEVADQLYALPPEQFTVTRNARAQAAKAAGDKETAARIAALRKPTVLAWMVNLLVRELPDEIGGFLDLGDALREATATLSGPELRQLSGQRHRLVQALVRQARELALQAGYRTTEDVARGLEETLAAALADPAVAEQLRVGRRTSGLTAIGFPAPSAGTVRAARHSPRRDRSGRRSRAVPEQSPPRHRPRNGAGSKRWSASSETCGKPRSGPSMQSRRRR